MPPDLTALYRETYNYDPAGNMLNLRHQQAVSSNGGTSWETTWLRNFGMGLAPEDWNQEWGCATAGLGGATANLG